MLVIIYPLLYLLRQLSIMEELVKNINKQCIGIANETDDVLRSLSHNMWIAYPIFSSIWKLSMIRIMRTM
ncbi:MAG: hypothetical protein Pg6B_09230 [Candidatus Azobacteroides pseudotrichonymphae]|jgi:hypothetical protein|nr:MAG: hypothetical protein Pg6B_09230 [Candidatus Azobacteroides pseudotrichonymphae]